MEENPPYATVSSLRENEYFASLMEWDARAGAYIATYVGIKQNTRVAAFMDAHELAHSRNCEVR